MSSSNCITPDSKDSEEVASCLARIESATSLMSILPKNIVLKLDGKEYRYLESFTVVLGGYATVETAKFVGLGSANAGYEYYSFEVAEARFNLKQLLDECIHKPFVSLTPEMQEFVVGYFHLSQGKNPIVQFLRKGSLV